VKFDYVFWAFFAFVVASMAWRYFRSGSFTGAMLGGTIKREIDQASVKSGSFSSQTLKVFAMESAEGRSSQRYSQNWGVTRESPGCLPGHATK
jgi:hypothetical protein